MIRRKTGDFSVDRDDGTQIYFDTGSQQWSDGYCDATATTSEGPPPPPTAVGGTVYPVNKAQVLALWLCLFLILSLAMSRIVFDLRKKGLVLPNA